MIPYLRKVSRTVSSRLMVPSIRASSTRNNTRSATAPLGLVDRVQECADDDAPNARVVLQGGEIDRDKHIHLPGQEILSLEAAPGYQARIRVVFEPVDFVSGLL